MWLESTTQIASQDWNAAHLQAPLQAAYRRGVLRAKVNVCELSCNTASIECMENPCPGTRVWLTFAGLESRAALVESSGRFQAVLRFEEPFHPAVLDAVLNGAISRYH